MVRIMQSAINDIINTLGKQRPEEGGVLFTDDGGTISSFVHDTNGRKNGGIYSPDTDTINNEIRRHNNRGEYFCGVAHSHPQGYTGLSMGRYGKKDDYTYSDEEAIIKLFQGMKGTPTLYFPVVQSAYGNAKFSMRMFVAQRRHDGSIKIYEDSWQVVESNEYDKRLIQNIMPLKKYADNTAIVIGLKCSADCVERLARNGVRKFVLIDSYRYGLPDIGTIAVYNEVGTYIADSVARKIKAINPLAEVRIIRRTVDETVDINHFVEWVNGINRSRSVVIACTDKCEINSAVEKLVANTRIPFLSVYYDGRFICSEFKDYYVTSKPTPIRDYTTAQNSRLVVPTLNDFAMELALSFFDKPIVREARLAVATTGIKPQVSKFDSLYKEEEIAQKTVVVVGCGGSRSYVENLARSGVRRFVLWDGDSYSKSNLQTQMAYLSELGQNKAEMIALQIKQIRPDAEVIVAAKMLDAKVSDDEFAATVGGVLIERPYDVLIAGCTDNFKAQARCSRLALKYGTPYLQAGIYSGGHIFELVFFHPAISKVCPRCMLKRRYEVNLSSNNVPPQAVSDGTSVFFTEALNAQKGYISLSLLLFRSKTADKRYANFMDDNQWETKRGSYDRNFMFYTLDQHMAGNTGIKAYATFDKIGQKMGSNYLSGVCLYRKRRPRKGCPDCGGKGDLSIIKGTIADTRDGIYSKEEY